MGQLILVVHVFVCIAIIALVLLQHGKGADMGAAFGSGASNTVFGSQGSSSFLLKITGLFAAVFFATSLGLGYLASHHLKSGGELDIAEPTITVEHEKSLPIPAKDQQLNGSSDTIETSHGKPAEK